MIRRPHKGSWLLLPQPAHAALCGALAQAWGGDGFSLPEPRISVLRAAWDHDNGWAEWEEEPGLNARGEPAHFTEMAVPDHLAIWERGVARAVAQDPYAGLLVSLHGVGLYRGDLDPARDTPEARGLVAEFLTGQGDLQRRLRQELRTDPVCGEFVGESPLMHNSRLIQLWDWLSLLLCCGRPEAQVIGGAAGRAPGERVDFQVHPRDDTTIRLKPYPFLQSPLTLNVTGRVVPREPFGSRASFLQTYREAPVASLSFRLERGSAWSGLNPG